MKKAFGEYYIGLDVGTDSVGWAVTNENYELLRFNGKSMWGSRLFSEGKTSAQRRLYRSNRRRLSRKEQRVKLLKSLFNEEITKIDPTFFLRLEYSKYQYKLGHKDGLSTDDTLFADENYKDKDYHKNYPTIYHLRNELVNENDITDPRLLYLACEHIIKHRGHFLLEGDVQTSDSFEMLFDAYKETILNIIPDWNLDYVDYKELQAILKDTIGINNKKSKLKELFNCTDKIQEEVVNLLAGGKCKFKTLFEIDEDFSYSLKEDYDENLEKFENIGEDCAKFVEASKAIYDWALLANILNGKKYLCEGKVESYNKHKDDLKKLKNFVKKYCSKDVYNIIFNENEKVSNNYVAYSAKYVKNNRKESIEVKKCSQEDFCKFLRSQFKDIKLEDVDDNGKYILDQISPDKNTLCPKQKNNDNSVVPYQVNLIELKAILNNAEKNFKWLNNVDEEGLSVIDKIIKLLTFKIPYYVGPINITQKGDDVIRWVEQKKQKVTPWNFEKTVNVEISAEKFIRRMTNKCQYLPNEDVIPKESILYSKYRTLNELNNVTVLGERLDVETKQDIFNNLYLKQKKVTKKDICKFLAATGKGNFDVLDLGGLANDIESSMKSYVEFKNILGERYKEQFVEAAITAITLFGQDKKILKDRLKNIGNSYFTEDEIKRISNLKYSGWAPFSRKLLEEIDNENADTGEVTGENYSIIDALFYTRNNFSELLSNKYNYIRNIEKENSQYGSETNFSYSDLVEDLYCSPNVKKGIWQTLLIVKEIVKICGHQPNKIFIEMARDNGQQKEDGRTFSRKNKLDELYNKCKKEEPLLYESLKETDNAQLRKDALYLYYIQRGKCMYTGEPINIEDIYNNNIYDIDHIYPRSKTKDDSLENRVLVKKQANINKTDTYPISDEIRVKMKSYWTDLYNKGFIGKEKYDRLTRCTPLSDEELAGFIARQLVETRQSTKELAKLLSRLYGDSKIVYVKAKNVSDFKNENDLVKVRDLNDLHHAKDAYCNIVVGNVWEAKFSNDPLNYILKSKGKERTYNLARMFDYDLTSSNRVIWKSGENGSITTVKKMYYRNDAIMTIKPYENHGELFDLQLVKKGKGQHKIKNNDPKLDIENYGGYNKVSTAYFVACRDSKNNLSIEHVSVEEAKKGIVYDVQGKAVVQKALKNSVFELDGYRCYLPGRGDNRLLMKTFMPLTLNEEDQKYIKVVMKYRTFIEKDQSLSVDNFCDKYNIKITKERNNQLFETLINKFNSKYAVLYKKFYSDEYFEKFMNLNIDDQCKLLSSIPSIFKSETVDFSKIGGAKTIGDSRINKNLKDFKSIKIINQSITGLFEREIVLK